MNATNIITDLLANAADNLNNGASPTGSATTYFEPLSGWITVEMTVDRIGRTRRSWYLRGYRISIGNLHALLAAL